MRKEKLRKNGICLITGSSIKPLKIKIIFLFRKLVRSEIFAFYYQDDARNIKRGNWDRQIARNGKLQYLFQKKFQSFSNEHNTNQFSLLTKCA